MRVGIRGLLFVGGISGLSLLVARGGGVSEAIPAAPGSQAIGSRSFVPPSDWVEIQLITYQDQ